jgi:hypothetical protein
VKKRWEGPTVVAEEKGKFIGSEIDPRKDVPLQPFTTPRERGCGHSTGAHMALHAVGVDR